MARLIRNILYSFKIITIVIFALWNVQYWINMYWLFILFEFLCKKLTKTDGEYTFRIGRFEEKTELAGGKNKPREFPFPSEARYRKLSRFIFTSSKWGLFFVPTYTETFSLSLVHLLVIAVWAWNPVNSIELTVYHLIGSIFPKP